MSLKSAIKGWIGEVQGTLAKKLFLDAETYFDINNVTVPTANGTTQIDHIIVSRFGIFVVETKNIDGWIYGDEKSPQWMQNLFGKLFKFQNPLHQNYRHTRALSDFLGIEHEKFFSVVMFWGECQFKTTMPENVMDRGYTGYIKSKTQVLFSEAEVVEIVTAIKAGMLSKTWKTRREHIQILDQRFTSTTSCPKCGSKLVLRTARSGKSADGKFYGCSGFPRCRYTRGADRDQISTLDKRCGL
jgi:restriction system protein